MKQMSFSKQPLTNLAICFVVLVCATIWAFVPGFGRVQSAQERSRRFDKSESYSNEPLQITDIKLGTKRVRLGEDFGGTDDWLKTAELTLKNVSGKDIVFVEVDLNFPETKSSGNEMSFPIRLGTRPGPADSPTIVLPHNHEATLALDEKHYQRLVQFIEHRHPISFVGRVVVNVGFVIFADGTAWSGGSFFRRDPNNPNRYIHN
jgi:hypothetical protein